MSVSLGLVGCGAFGRAFVPLFRDHPAVHRFALCDIDPDRLRHFADEFGVSETYPELEAICHSDLDAVVVITQHWMHAGQVIQVLEAGKHAYSAVPPAQTLDDLDALVRTVERTGRLYMLGETSYFRAECAYVRERAAKGDLGHLVHIEAEYLHDFSHGLYEVATRRWGKDWNPRKSGGSPMLYPTHSMCYPISITGSHATSVSCLGYAMPDDDWWRADTDSGCLHSDMTALFRLACGATAQTKEYRRIGYHGAERATRVHGTEATFEWGPDGCWWIDKNRAEKVTVPRDFEPLPEALARDKGGHGGSHAYLANEFVTAVDEGRQPRINVWQAARYCAPGLVAAESAKREGERLPVPDWPPPDCANGTNGDG